MKSDKRTLHKINRKCTNTFCISTVDTKYKQTVQKILLSAKTKWRIQFRQLRSFFSIFVIRIFCLFNKERHEHGKKSCTIKAYIGRDISWHVFFVHFPLWFCKPRRHWLDVAREVWRALWHYCDLVVPYDQLYLTD